MMREFFKGWRRKAGCVALVIACTLTVAWIRSHNTVDGLNISIGNRCHAIGSMRSGVAWFAWDSTSEQLKEEWTVQSHSAYEMGFHRRSLAEIVELWIRSAKEMGQLNPRAWAAPYWSIVLPLSLLSAYLILWKPRKKAAKPD